MPFYQHILPFECTTPGLIPWIIFISLCVISLCTLTALDYFTRPHQYRRHLIARRLGPTNQPVRLNLRRDGRRNGFIDPSEWDEDYFLRRLGSRNHPVPFSVRGLSRRGHDRRGGGGRSGSVSDDEGINSDDEYSPPESFHPPSPPPPRLQRTGRIRLPIPQPRERIPLEGDRLATDFYPVETYLPTLREAYRQRVRQEGIIQGRHERPPSPFMPRSRLMFEDSLDPNHAPAWAVDTGIDIRRTGNRGTDGRFLPPGIAPWNVPAGFSGDHNVGNQNREGFLPPERPQSFGLQQRLQHRRVLRNSPYAPRRSTYIVRSRNSNRNSRLPALDMDVRQQTEIPATTRDRAVVIRDTIRQSQPSHTQRQHQENRPHLTVIGSLPQFANAAHYGPHPPEFSEHLHRGSEGPCPRDTLSPSSWSSSDSDPDVPENPYVLSNQPRGADQQAPAIHEERQHRFVADSDRSTPTSSRSSSPNAPKNPYVLANQARDIGEHSLSGANLVPLGVGIDRNAITRERVAIPTDEVACRRASQHCADDSQPLPPNRVPNSAETDTVQNRRTLAQSAEADCEEPESSHRPRAAVQNRERTAVKYIRSGGGIRIVPLNKYYSGYQACYESAVEDDETEGSTKERDV